MGLWAGCRRWCGINPFTHTEEEAFEDRRLPVFRDASPTFDKLAAAH
jgi:hypothetical protein